MMTDELPGYTQLPSWAWLPPLLLGVGVLTSAALVVLASRRSAGVLRWAVPALGGLTLLSLSWWALSPVTVEVRGQSVQCGTATRNAFVRGNPTDATLNHADRACRTQARKVAVGQAVAVVAVGGVAALIGGRRRRLGTAKG
jgi:hypothetical protein